MSAPTLRRYQQALDLEKAEQMKRPTEDLEVRGSFRLLPLPRLSWMRLPDAAFADLLMVVEFCTTFVAFLELETPPTLEALYSALYDGGVAWVTVLSQLLKAALYDPGECVRV